jgi:hypothetical protein
VTKLFEDIHAIVIGDVLILASHGNTGAAPRCLDP